MATTYDHTQRGYSHWMLYCMAFLLLCVGWLAPHEGLAPYLATGVVFTVVGVLISLLAASFHYLRVVDGGDRLLLQFGPLPLLRGSIVYKSMVAVEADRSLLIDGWGIHWLPGRGWTYNIWGFDCVVVTLDSGKMMRVGSDDAENLRKFLRLKLTRADIEFG